MSGYIDADVIDYDDYWWHKGYTAQECKQAERLINEQPTADVVEVVRCKDCVHYQPSLFGEKNMCFRKDVDGVQICYDFSPDDFCSYGEVNE